MKRAAALLMLAAWVSQQAFALPRFDEVKAAHRPSDIEFVDRNGQPVQTLRVDTTVRRFAWMPLAEMSPALREAVVLSEDKRFWVHGGVDWRALAGAAWANAWNEKTRGASTLTMQLAGLLDDELARPAGGRGVVAKLDQALAAKALEREWTKAQILEAYLNRVPLRADLVGVPAASWTLFGRRPSGLDATESAILAALLRAPNAGTKTVARRACDLLQQQRRSCAGLETSVEQALARRPRAAPGETLAPHFAKAWQAAGGGTRLPLDARVQRVAMQALRQQLAELRGRNVDDGAAVVLDNASGEVLAWVGSAGPASGANDVDAVLARRQPGSTLKPFVYALAFERRLLTPASRLDDAPFELEAGSGLYAPQNYDHGFKGEVSARTALASSLNVPAVRVGAMLGPDELFERLQRAGLDLKESAGFHGPALALGTAEVTLLDLTDAYRMLANGGRWSAPRLNGKAGPAPRRAFDANAVYLVADILADASARATTFGFDSPLVTRGWAAVKTGTSKDMRDNWCVGFTDRYTVGVWVGNASGEAMHAVSGVSGAAPVWRQIVAFLHDGQPSKPPRPPSGLSWVGGQPFVAGTEPAARLRGAAGRFGIDSPRDGSIIVIDPEIPPAQQRLVFEGARGRWSIDGVRVGEGERVDWRPRPGRHRLEREGGGSSDRVDFEVRVAPLNAQDAGAKMRSTAASMTMPHRL